MNSIPNHPDDVAVDDPLLSCLPKFDWVAYHGTSSLYSASIESRGLDASATVWTRGDCQRVCDAYETIEWYGSPESSRKHGGYAVLRACVLDHDRQLSGRRALYLAESFARASRYASLAGGETATALLGCLEDLLLLEQSPSLRLANVESLARQCARAGYELDESHRLRQARLGRHESYDAKLHAIDLLRDPSWLRVQNVAFTELRQRLVSALAGHEPVVYGVRVRMETLADAQYSNIGIEIRQRIPPEDLLCKSQPALRRPFPVGSTTMEEFAVQKLWHDRVQAARETNVRNSDEVGMTD